MRTVIRPIRPNPGLRDYVSVAQMSFHLKYRLTSTRQAKQRIRRETFAHQGQRVLHSMISLWICELWSYETQVKDYLDQSPLLTNLDERLTEDSSTSQPS